MAYNINKYYQNILGLDLRVSDLLRQSGAATETNNIMFRQTGALSKRPGYQIKTPKGSGGSGVVKFNNIEIGTGTITEELVCMDDNLRSYIEQTITLTYSGSTTSYYNLYLDPTTSTFKFEMYEDNAIVLNTDLGTGQGASDTSVAQLKVLVDAITDFAMTHTGSGGSSVAFSPIARNVSIVSAGTTTQYFTWAGVATPGTYADPFTTHYATRNAVDFEIMSTAQMLDVLYIANGYDDLHKYDGSRVYKAGLPKPTTPTDSVGAGSALTAGEYDWKYSYEHTDAKQNILSSPDSDITEFTSAGSDSRVVVMSHVLAASGYGNAQAVVDGNQSGVNAITVTAGHDLKVKDQVYINDGVTGEIVKREVTVVAATEITVDGAAVNVTSTDALSQLKITLWRTQSGGTLFYQVKEFVNNNATASVSYDDVNADASLVIEKIDTVKVAALPPKCRYLDVWRGQLVMTGNRDNVNTVYYSDFDGESFPVDQSFITEARLGGGNSGLKSLDNSLFVFKPRSIITTTGDLGTDTFQVDALSDDGVGCIANATIKEVNQRLWFLGKQGVYSVDRRGHVKESEKIDPKFDTSYTEKRAVAHYWIEKDLYVVELPDIILDGSNNRYLNTSATVILVYDLYRQSWYTWDTMNITGGVAEYNGSIYFMGVALDPTALTATQLIYRVADEGTADDYADHESPISFTYKSHWESMGEPSIYKKFLRMKIHALDGTIDDFETDTFTLAVSTEHDYTQSTESSFSLDFSGGAIGWGESGWGDFIWGESRLEQMRSKLKSKKAKALRTIFENNTTHENILISGYELEVALSYDVQIKD